jgi:hypothetical protein
MENENLEKIAEEMIQINNKAKLKEYCSKIPGDKLVNIADTFVRGTIAHILGQKWLYGLSKWPSQIIVKSLLETAIEKSAPEQTKYKDTLKYLNENWQYVIE